MRANSPADCRKENRTKDLTRVELTWFEKRIEHWIRFGRIAEETIIDRRQRVVSFAPGVLDADENRRVADLETVQGQDRQNAPSVIGSRNLLDCHAVAKGPVSASPSPTMSPGLSNAAPKAWLSKYPSSPPLDVRGLVRRLDLLFHWLESGSEHGSGQLGYMAAIADSGFDAVLDQLLLQFDELSRAFHGGKFLNRGSQILGVFSRQFLIRLGQLLNTCSRGVAAFGQSGCTALHDRLCDLAALGLHVGIGLGDGLNDRIDHGWISFRNEDCFRPSTVTCGQMAVRLGNYLLPMRDGVISGAAVLPMLRQGISVASPFSTWMHRRSLLANLVKEESKRVGS